MYKPMSRITVPMTVFKIVAVLLDFPLSLIFWTNQAEVPETMASVLCPMEYSSIRVIP